MVKGKSKKSMSSKEGKPGSDSSAVGASKKRPHEDIEEQRQSQSRSPEADEAQSPRKEQEPEQSQSPEHSEHPENPEHHPSHSTKDFEAWYLQQITAEFADDIDEVRQSADFDEDSLPILVRALKQGASRYSEGQRRTLMGLGKSERKEDVEEEEKKDG